MHIQLNGVSKRYLRRWIIKDLDYRFEAGQVYGITGINGSGKSTLVKIISGYLTPSRGAVEYIHGSGQVSRDNIYNHLSISAPYLEVDLDLTLKEQLAFYREFKPLVSTFDEQAVLAEIGLLEHFNKPIRQFSSGMQQRVQLILCLFAKVDIILLDEPTSFLDVKGKAWFYKTLQEVKKNKLVILASNDDLDISQCDTVLNLDIVIA